MQAFPAGDMYVISNDGYESVTHLHRGAGIMKDIFVSDITIRQMKNASGIRMTFKEKLELAKQIEKLGVSVIELEPIENPKADSLLVKSIAQTVQDSVIAVPAGNSADSIRMTWEALKGAAHPRLQIRVPVSPTRMEYVFRKKADAVAAWVSEAVALARTLTDDVEFAADDAARADKSFLYNVLSEAVEAGATTVTLCDTAGLMLPEEWKCFISEILEAVPALKDVRLGVECSDELMLADALAVAAIQAGAGEIKASVQPMNTASIRGLARVLSLRGEALQVKSSVHVTEIRRLLSNIDRIFNKPKSEHSPFEDGVRDHEDGLQFSADDSMEEVMKSVRQLGYELDETDQMRVWNAFQRISARKEQIDLHELDVIIASEAMQVPAAYTLENYVVTTGNALDIVAHVKLRKDGELLDGLSLGDGPIDAAFLAIEKVTGRHFELDDFQIQAITEGREAMGQSIVKLRSEGHVYAGAGVSTDIIGSGIEAYINALNKIVYEEENE